MSEYFQNVKKMLSELNFVPDSEDPQEEIVVISEEDRGISNMVLDCEEPILILEQFIVELSNNISAEHYKSILQLNRTLVHGAFVLDETGTKLLYRDTLELENLDLNELEGTINSLTIALAESAAFFLKLRSYEEVE